APAAAWKEVEASCFNWKIVMENLQEGGSWDQNSLSPRLPHCLSAKRDQNVKLDFGPPIATFVGSSRLPLPPEIEWRPDFPTSSRKRGFRRGRCSITARACSIRRCGLASPGCHAPARRCSSPR